MLARLLFAVSGVIKSITGLLLWTLDNPNPYGTSANDNFGDAVSISDSYAIVGAKSEDDAGGTESGKAYIYDIATGALLWTLDNPNDYDTSLDDTFGEAVSISENYAIVGTSTEDDAGGTSSGKAYIFNPATGALLWTLDNPNAYGTSANDRFGHAVSISDSYAIVGAFGEDDAGGTFSGKAYIFNPATGALLWTLDNPNAYGTSASDFFGLSVSISDSYAIVGAYSEDEGGGGSASGKAYIFNPATGALLWTLDNPNPYGTPNDDYFGESVSISETYAIVGAHGEDEATGSHSGKAYIYDNATGALLWTLDNVNAYGTPEIDYFALFVSISETYAIVSAYIEDDPGGLSSGKAYVFNPATGALLWTLDNPNAYDTSGGDSFGHSVSISDSHAIAGAYAEDDAGGTSSGKAYIFELKNQLIRKVDQGVEHTMVLTAAGNVYGWGRNDYGQVNPGDLTNPWITVPTLIKTGVVDMSCGSQYTMCLLANGDLVGWGDNAIRQVNPTSATTPWLNTSTVIKSGVSAISAGGFHMIALLDNGDVVGWGHNNSRQANPNSATTPWNTTTAVIKSGVASIGTATYHSFAIMPNDDLVGWGSNWDLQLDPLVSPGNYTDVTTVLRTGVSYATGGTANTLVLLTNGDVSSWGRNSNRECNPLSATNPWVDPSTIHKSGVKQLASGGSYTMCVLNNGDVVGWGGNHSYELNPLSVTDPWVDTTTVHKSGVEFVACMQQHTTAVLINGNVVGWGSNNNRQTNPASGTDPWTDTTNVVTNIA